MKQVSIPMLGFIQATIITVFCGVVLGYIFNSNVLFTTYFNVEAVFILAVVSLLFCLITAIGKALIIITSEKNTKKALSLIAYTAAWLVLYFVVVFSILVLNNK